MDTLEPVAAPVVSKRLSEAVAELIRETDSHLIRDAAAAVGNYTRMKMYRLWHIPNRYFIPPTDPAKLPEYEETFSKLVTELNRAGCIDLDRDGEPACLSGKPAVLQELQGATHGTG